MASPEQLLQDLRRLGVDPDEVRLPSRIYDRPVVQAEDISENEVKD